MKTLLTFIVFLVYGILTYLTAIIFFSSYLNSSGNQIDYYSQELTSLRKEMHLGIAKDMQALYPEGFVFTNVLYGLCSAELVRKIDDPSKKLSWQNETRWSLSEIESNYGKSVFDSSLTPIYGTFYHSWKTWLTGKYLSIIDKNNFDSTLYKNFQLDCKTIVNNYLVENNPYPESYKGVSWPADAIVGIASLELSDNEFHTDYSKFIEKWISSVKAGLATSKFLIPHSIQNSVPRSIEFSRGSSQSLILLFLYDIDGDFAKKQYSLFKHRFTDTFLFFSLIKESQANRTQVEDIDSGPIIFGFGSAASIVGIGTAKLYGDKELFSDLNLGIEFSRIPAKYFFGDHVIIDLFLLWSRISEPLVQQNKHLTQNSFNNIRFIFLIIEILYTVFVIVSIKTMWFKKHANSVQILNSEEGS